MKSEEVIILEKQRGALFVITRIITRLSSTFQHSMGHPLLKLRLDLEQLADQMEKDGTKYGNLVDNINKSVDEIQDISSKLTDSLLEFVHYGPIDISILIQNLFNYLDIQNHASVQNIKLSFNATVDNPITYASGFLKEHLYNIIMNSIQSVSLSLKNERIDQGAVTITIEPSSKNCNQKEYFDLTIEDNGAGVPKNLENKIGQAGFTTKTEFGGSGYGLAAAIEYVNSIGGNIVITNVEGFGFKVTLTLPIFKQDLHLDIFGRSNTHE